MFQFHLTDHIRHLLPPAPSFLIGFIYYWLTPVIFIHYFPDIIHISIALSTWVNKTQYDLAYLLNEFIVIICWLIGKWLGRSPESVTSI
ncbi:MAG: hypothetical protein RL297_125 [Pseudomonadota bacterium]|jgi:hypothetical protein